MRRGNEIGAEPSEGGGVEKELGVEHWLHCEGKNHIFDLTASCAETIRLKF